VAPRRRSVALIRFGRQVGYVTYEPGSDNVKTMTVDGVQTVFDYDSAGRLAQRTDTSDGRAFVTGYTFDGSDNLREITYPNGRRIRYEHDSQNRITRVYNPEGQQQT
jgi:YD repeat-containing protein